MRRELGVVRQHVPLDLASASRAPQHVRVRGPETVPPFTFRVIRQQRRLWCRFERFVRRGRRAADEVHESRGSDLSVRMSVQSETLRDHVSARSVGGEGNLENPISKRNSEVFHKSLSPLWIALVETCR